MTRQRDAKWVFAFGVRETPLWLNAHRAPEFQHTLERPSKASILAALHNLADLQTVPRREIA